MMNTKTSLLALTALLTACGRNATNADFKTAGVGLQPDSIQQQPALFGGLMTYDYVEFSGAALPLGLMGLSSYEGVAPDSSISFKPPYGLIFGSAFIFQEEAPVPDVMFGSLAVPPKQLGSCHTVFEPQAYLSGVADAGNHISILAADGSNEGFIIGRRPFNYPPDISKVFPYYTELSAYKDSARQWRNPADGVALSEWTPSDTRNGPNFPFGKEMVVRFPGAVTNSAANFASVPVPFSSDSADNNLTLPTKPLNVSMSWNGPKYSADGVELENGAHNVCLQFAPTNTEDGEEINCTQYTEMPTPTTEFFEKGQMYTGPWDTSDNEVKIKWTPNPSSDTVSISVRFLAAISEDTDSLVNEKVAVPKSPAAEQAWNSAINQNVIPEGAVCPDVGYRDALPCDENIEYVFDESMRKGDGYVPSLQGDPTSALVEVTCHVDDVNGEFTINNEMLSEALAYSRQHNAKGAIFYINRTTTTELDIPDVRDNFGNKRTPGKMLVSSNAASMGRFWVNPGTFE